MEIRKEEIIQDVIDCLLYSPDKQGLMEELQGITAKHKPPTYTNKQGIRVIQNVQPKKHFKTQRTLD